MRFFTAQEFKMGHVCVFDKMDTDFLLKLDMLRELLGEPMVITSSYRSESYNKGVGGSTKSMHLTGKAVDISISNYNAQTRTNLVQLALSLGLTVGVARTFIHLDDREVQTVFGY